MSIDPANWPGIEEYLKSERQWLRAHRIEHAAMRYSDAVVEKDEKAMAYWDKVLKRLRD